MQLGLRDNMGLATDSCVYTNTTEKEAKDYAKTKYLVRD